MGIFLNLAQLVKSGNGQFAAIVNALGINDRKEITQVLNNPEKNLSEADKKQAIILSKDKEMLYNHIKNLRTDSKDYSQVAMAKLALMILQGEKNAREIESA